MIPLLAATSTAAADANVFEVMTNIFSRPDALAHPQEMLPHLQAMSAVWSVVFVIAGLICLLHGYRFYRPVTVILALLIGAFVGYYLGKKIQAEYIVAGCLGLLLAVACYPLMKYAVAVVGGLVGAFLGANIWTAVARLSSDGAASGAADAHWVGALVGLLLCGMLAFILFKLSIVLFTSVSGSTLMVLGGVALLLQIRPWQQTVSSSISAHALIVPLMVLVPAVIGLILQEAPKGDAPAAKAPAK